VITQLTMDNDIWLMESGDTETKHLRSPGATSSGYCSSEEMLVSSSTNNTVRIKSNVSERLLTDLPLTLTIDCLSTGQDDVAKTNATFDGFADALWEPLPTSSVEDTSVPQSRVYRGLIAKQLAPTKKPVVIAPNSEAEFKIGQTISVWNRHVASELGNPFAQTVDDCKASSSVHCGGMSVDVSMSTKGQSSSSGSRTPTLIIRPVARARAAAPLLSCGTVLRRSATVPSKMPLVAGQGVVSQCAASRSDHLYSMQPQVLHAESTPSIHDALRDHMYASSPVHSSCVNLSRASRMTTRRSQSDASASRGSMSILEAFLRSTTPSFDANRGSTAIAAEELRKLNVSGCSSRPSVRVHREDDGSEMTSPAASLLKQLLTGSSSSSNSSHVDHGADNSATEQQLRGMAVDCLLTDGFGLDADLQLDDPLSNGIGLLQDECVDSASEVATDSTLVSTGSLLLVS